MRIIFYAVFISLISVHVHSTSLSVDDFLQDPQVKDFSVSPDGTKLASIWDIDGKDHVIIRDITRDELPIIGKFSSKIYQSIDVEWGNNERVLVDILVPFDTDDLEEKLENSKEHSKEYDKLYDEYVKRHRHYKRKISVNTKGADLVILMKKAYKLGKYRDTTLVSNKLINDSKHILMPLSSRGSFELHKVNIYDGSSKSIYDGDSATEEVLTSTDGKPTFEIKYSYTNKKYSIYGYVQKYKTITENINRPKTTKEDVEKYKSGKKYKYTVKKTKVKDGFEWIKIRDISFKKRNPESFDYDNHLVFNYGTNGELFYIKNNTTTGYKEIFSISTDKKEEKSVISHKNKDINSAIFDDRTRDLIGYVLDDDKLTNIFFDEKDQKKYQQLSDIVGGYQFYYTDLDAKRSIVTVTGRDTPASYFLYDPSSNDISFIKNAFDKKIDTNLAIPAKVSIKSRDGMKIPTYILLPPSFIKGKTYPMVVLPHGGPQHRDRGNYNDFAQFIATRGYIVIQMNFRGSTGYGLKFEEAGYKQWGNAMQNDIDDTTNFMVQNGYADSNNICIVGSSYGAYAAVMALAKSPKIYKCAAAINGPYDLIDTINYSTRKYSGSKKEIKKLLYNRIGNPNIPEEKVMLEENSPINLVKNINNPLLLFVGKNDSVVNPYETTNLYNELKDLGKPVQLIKWKYASHNHLFWSAHKRETYTEIEKFLEKNLNK